MVEITEDKKVNEILDGIPKQLYTKIKQFFMVNTKYTPDY